MFVIGELCADRKPVDMTGPKVFIWSTGVAIPPRGDMPKNRVLFHTRAQHVFLHHYFL